MKAAAIKTIFAGVLVVFVAHFFGWLVGCAALGQAFGTAEDYSNPRDDSAMFNCRLMSKADYGVNRDAGGAWEMYDECMRDGGYR